MPLLLVVSVVIQVLLAIHVVRSGNDRYWVFIILLFPVVGCLLYFILAVIPGMLRSYHTARMLHSVKARLNPEGKLHQLKDELLISETSQNYLAVADELHRLQQYKPAIEYYHKALSGIFSGDKDILCRLAKAQYAAGEKRECVQTIDKIDENYPRFKSQEIHLLCARALAGCGENVRAEREFTQLIEYYSGPQARYHYAEFLRGQQKHEEAIAQLENVLLVAERSRPHYRKYYKRHLRLVSDTLKTLKSR